MSRSRSRIARRSASMSRGTRQAAKANKIEHTTHAETQISKIAVCSGERTAVSPAIRGASAVLRTSGSVTSCAVETTFGAAKVRFVSSS